MQNQSKLKPPDWTIVKLIQWATSYFISHNIDSPRLTAEILLAHVLNSKRIDLYLHYDQPLNPDELKRFKELIKRRVNREPVAYILGYKEFWSMDLVVTRDVLIPRPETECLVENALENLVADSNSGSKFILELGTGCGAVILALASENPRHSYVATDISVNAIRVARQNAMRHNLNGKIHFVAGDWFAPFMTQPGLFDMIVSNPPYIKSDDLARLEPEIHAFEPIGALDGASDGLHCLRYIIRSAVLFLKPRGVLMLEIGHDQKDPLKQVITECAQYDDIAYYGDYSGYDRVVAMKKK